MDDISKLSKANLTGLDRLLISDFTSAEEDAVSMMGYPTTDRAAKIDDIATISRLTQANLVDVEHLQALDFNPDEEDTVSLIRYPSKVETFEKDYIYTLVEKYIKAGVLSRQGGLPDDIKLVCKELTKHTLCPWTEEKDKLPIRTKRSKDKEDSIFEFGFSASYIPGWDEIPQLKTICCEKRIINAFRMHKRPDIEIRIKNETFHCHKVVLKYYSEFFRLYCKGKTTVPEVQLCEQIVTPYAFAALYDLCLADTPRLERRGIAHVYNAAVYLGMPIICEQIDQFFCDIELFYECQATLLYLEARIFKLSAIQSTMLLRVCKFFLTFVSSMDFLRLDWDEVAAFLQTNGIGVNNEAEIFYTAVRWLTFKWEEREQHLPAVLRPARCRNLPIWVSLYVDAETHPDFLLLAKHEFVQKMKTEILLCNARTKCLANTHGNADREVALQRIWIYDSECPYHHYRWCEKLHLQKFSYGDFLNYLTSLNENPRRWKSVKPQTQYDPKVDKCCAEDVNIDSGRREEVCHSRLQ